MDGGEDMSERFFIYEGFKAPIMLKLYHYNTTSACLWDLVVVVGGVAIVLLALTFAYGR
jgi:hypothetical protein